VNSFPFLQALIVTQNAFPDIVLICAFVLRSLIAATDNHPRTTHICHRLLNDHIYLDNMCYLVRRSYVLLKTFHKISLAPHMH